MKKLKLMDFYIQKEREVLSEYFSQNPICKKSLEKLNNILQLELTCKENETFGFNSKEFFDGIFGAVVILAGTKGRVVETKIYGDETIYFDYRKIEYAIFFVIAEILKQTEKKLKISVKVNENIYIKFKSDKQVKFKTDFYSVLQNIIGEFDFKRDGDEEFVFFKKKQTVKKIIPKKEYEYLSNPYSVAFVVLNLVCINPKSQEKRKPTLFRQPLQK